MIFLAQLTVRPGGYRIGRTFGWAHADDLYLLAGTTYVWADALARFADRRHADVRHANVRTAALPSPLFRITQSGMDTVARLVGEIAPSVCPPCLGECCTDVYASNLGQWALRALREAYPNWLTAAEVLKPIRRWNRCGNVPYVTTGDLTALVSSGLAESCCTGDHRSTPAYRVSRAGCTATLLEWYGPDPEARIFSDHDWGHVLKPPMRGFLYGSGN